MPLQGSDNAEKIWNYLKGKGLNDYGTAGLMGNLFAESGLNPANLQNSFEKKLGMNDDQYTTSVDNGDYQNFVHDGAGYGLAQWTFWSRKANLHEFVKHAGKSISDLETQLDFLIKELSENYKSVFLSLKSASSVAVASNCVLLQYERPANMGTSVQSQRASYGATYYQRFVNKSGGIKMSNSSLVNCTVKSPNHSGARTHSIDTITPHCVVGQLSASAIGGCFTSSSRQASCNYGIGTDGSVVLCVDECNRSWCSSSNSNDQRAVTIECASDKTDPYAMNDKVYAKLIDLCVDICKRNGKSKLLWLGDKTKTLNYQPKSDEMVITVHRWFANKSCPGDWLYNRLGDLASRVTSRLGGGGSSSASKDFPAVPFSVTVLISDLNYRSQPSMSGVVKGQTGKGVFTIVEVKDGWGRLKSGAGWIYLENPEYCTIGKSASSAPTYREYTVKHGDSLWAIAAAQLGDGKRWTEIKSLNGLSSNVLYSGQVLKLPN